MPAAPAPRNRTTAASQGSGRRRTRSPSFCQRAADLLGRIRLAGPERPLTGDSEHGRQERQAGEQDDRDPDRVHRPERPVEPQDSREHGEHRGHHGHRARDHRRRGLRERAADGVRHVAAVAEVGAVARDEQQAVVGAGAEHEHEQQRRRRAVHRKTRLREQVDHSGGDRVGHHHDDERQQCQQRRAVDREQEQQHEQAGREQQLRVRLLDRGVEVAQERRRAGHVALEAAAGLREGAEVLDRRPDAEDPLRGEREDGDGDVSARGDESGRRERLQGAVHERHLGRPPRVGGDPPAVRGGQPAGAAVDEQDLLLVAAREARLDDPMHLGGLRARRQDDLVVRQLRQLQSERSEDREQHGPGRQNRPLRAAASPCSHALDTNRL